MLSLTRHLTASDAAARWLARFAPVVARDAAPGTCSPHPWAHVRHGPRQLLREGYAAVLRDRVAASAPPVRLSPPEPDHDGWAVPGGCLVCGVEAVTLPAARVAVLGGRQEVQREVWRPLTAASPSVLCRVRPGPDQRPCLPPVRRRPELVRLGRANFDEAGRERAPAGERPP